MEQVEKNVKLLKLLGMIFGLVGAGVMLFSLLMDASVVNSVFGSISVPMTKYLEGIVWVVFLIAACSIAFSIMRWDIPLTVIGAIAVAFSVFMITHIGSAGQDGKYATVSFGAGLIIFFLAAALMLAAGILYIVAKSKAKKAGIPYSFVLDNVFGKSTPAVAAPQEAVDGEATDDVDETPAPAAPVAAPSKGKKIGIIVGICVGAVLIIGGGIFGTMLYYKAQQLKEATAAVESFMSYAKSDNTIGMNAYLNKNYSDKNKFLVAYQPDTLAEKNLEAAGISMDYFGSLNYDLFKYSCDDIGKNYIKKYEIGEVTDNGDGSYSAKASVSVLDTNDVTDKFVDNCNNISVEKYEDEIYAIMLIASDEEEAKEMLYDMLLPDIEDAMEDAIKDAGTKKEELTIVVSKVSDEYKVTKIQVN